MSRFERNSAQKEPWSSGRSIVLAALLLIALVFSCFSMSLLAGLLSDDFINLNLLATKPIEMLCQGFSGRQMELPIFGEHYRPAITFFYLLDYFVYGANPVGLHFSNMLWHSAATILAFLFCLQTTAEFEIKHSFQVSLWTAILFAIHPFHCEPIDWWIAKNDIIYSTCYLLSFSLFIAGRKSEQAGIKAGSLFCFLLALSCKETALTLPFVICLFLFIKDKSTGILAKLKNTIRSSSIYWLILCSFALIRSLLLAHGLGGYYGPDKTYNIARIIESFKTPEASLTLLFPIDGGSANVSGKILFAILALIYATAFYSLSKVNDAGAQRNSLKACIFSFFSFLIMLAPVCYIWHPDQGFESYRLLYLAILPLLMILPLCLFANTDTNKLANISLFLFSSILFSSSLHCQNRWLLASQACAALKKSLAIELEKIPRKKKLILLNLPSNIEGISLRTHFIVLQSMLMPPFDSSLDWQKLAALEPHFFGDSNTINLARLKELNSQKISYEILSCNKDLSFSRINLPKSPEPGNQQALTIEAIDLGLKGDYRYTYFRLPTKIKPEQYQLAKISFKVSKDFEATSNFSRLIWKSSQEQNFNFQNSQTIYKRLLPSKLELNVHLGELVNWLNSPEISELEIVSDTNIQPQELTLLSEQNLVPQLYATAEQNILGADSVWRAAKDILYFNYDASALPDVKSVRVEISAPCLEFRFFTQTNRDDTVSKNTIKSFEIEGNRGKFELSNKLGSPCWHQIRIFALDKTGSVIGYSSDPLNIQSVTGRADDGDFVMRQLKKGLAQ